MRGERLLDNYQRPDSSRPLRFFVMLKRQLPVVRTAAPVATAALKPAVPPSRTAAHAQPCGSHVWWRHAVSIVLPWTSHINRTHPRHNAHTLPCRSHNTGLPQCPCAAAYAVQAQPYGKPSCNERCPRSHSTVRTHSATCRSALLIGTNSQATVQQPRSMLQLLPAHPCALIPQPLHSRQRHLPLRHSLDQHLPAPRHPKAPQAGERGQVAISCCADAPAVQPLCHNPCRTAPLHQPTTPPRPRSRRKLQPLIHPAPARTPARRAGNASGPRFPCRLHSRTHRSARARRYQPLPLAASRTTSSSCRLCSAVSAGHIWTTSYSTLSTGSCTATTSRRAISTSPTSATRIEALSVIHRTTRLEQVRPHPSHIQAARTCRRRHHPVGEHPVSRQVV